MEELRLCLSLKETAPAGKTKEGGTERQKDGVLSKQKH